MKNPNEPTIWIIDHQEPLCPRLPEVLGNADYTRLEEELREADVLLLDSFCLKANIHFPTDWVLSLFSLALPLAALPMVGETDLRTGVRQAGILRPDPATGPLE